MPPRPQPKFKITWWMRFRSKIRCLHTPLSLRHSIVRLRHNHNHPFLALLKLFTINLRAPSWNWSYDYPLPKPLAPQDIAANEALFDCYHPDLFDLRYIPIWTIRDTPLRAIYRLYEILMTQEFVLLRLECEYMWKQQSRKWSLGSIPDPCDPDPVRYAILASVVEELVKAFNWRLAHGQRKDGRHVRRTKEIPWPEYDPEVVPCWTASVPAIGERDLSGLAKDIVKDGMLLLGDGGCENFIRRNFDAPTRYLYTT
ncbi:hypothetical protein ONS95_001245 [Cadophora gregata]|uniref:uncharacterized protein n=1 Tax=Cadophora gregata TaxID=51156 RepID=UPI0026DB8BDA|nr:uncharacterized protein ONS95_001245 [Cadophora gregata]KAK0101946.1 hypothetical protein ONS96_005916 [Cadophora gregata f. sp. sojae]KAK0129313.1 hypothetical protein ONS95_001245 [Cadophora gregata]